MNWSDTGRFRNATGAGSRLLREALQMSDPASVPPTGTVTFLFSDVEGSTRMWEESSEEMAAALERHDDILRSSIENHGGYIFSTAGDAFSAAFPRVGSALAAAVEAQLLLVAEPWPAPTVLRVRMGLHTGEAHERDGDYFGTSLNRTARIMSAGHGGQILTSEVTAALLAQEGAGLRQVGTLQLRGLSAPEAVWQVAIDGLAVDFPPLRNQVSVGNLPQDPDRFIGRESELGELSKIIRDHRLVTLTGVGGVGKTRLATTCGWRWSDEFPDGVWLVKLADVSDDEEIALAVAVALGLRTQPGMSPLDSVVEILSSQRVLIVLDNCEHVLDGAAEFVERLLARSGSSRVLATSREGLGAAGERLVAVRSLETSTEGGAANELFVERATAAGWTLRNGDEPAIAELCSRLDGVPLAIELAAARARAMPVSEIVERLDDRFRLLTGRRRRVERHQTLRATVGWSYELLTEPEKRLFQRLSVFVGPFTLFDAEHVCADGDLDGVDVDLHLGSLVDKSMVVADDGWYRLLETLRQFAAELFASSADPSKLHERHVRHFAEVAASAREGLWTRDEDRWIHRLDRAMPNFWEAMRGAIEIGEVDAAAAIVGNLAGHLNWSGSPEVVPRAAEVLDLPGVETARSFPMLLARAGMAYIWANDLSTAENMASRGRRAVQDGGVDTDLLVADLTAMMLNFDGHADQAAEVFRASAQAAKALNAATESYFLSNLATALDTLERGTEAEKIGREALHVAEASGNPTMRCWSRLQLSGILTEARPEEAQLLLQELLELGHRLNSFFFASAQCRLARFHTIEGDVQKALALALQPVRSARRIGSPGQLWNYLLYMAIALDAADEPDVVAQLLGGLHNSWIMSVLRVRPWINELDERTSLRLGVETKREQFERGKLLSSAEAALLAEQAAVRLLAQPQRTLGA